MSTNMLPQLIDTEPYTLNLTEERLEIVYTDPNGSCTVVFWEHVSNTPVQEYSVECFVSLLNDAYARGCAFAEAQTAPASMLAVKPSTRVN